MKSIVFFNNKGGVDKTALTFNIAHSLAEQNLRTIVIDYNPQCSISTIFLDELTLFDIWEAPNQTVTGCLESMLHSKNALVSPELQQITDGLWLLPGHLALSRFEQILAAEEFSKKHVMDDEHALDVSMSLDLLSNLAAEKIEADVVILDVGPSLDTLNRAVLLACDFVIFPVNPDLFSLQGLHNIGSTLREWRQDRASARERRLHGKLQEHLPPHEFLPAGYMVQQHLARADQPATGHARWAARIPADYRRYVLNEAELSLQFEDDPHCLALIPHYASLASMALEARKPIFDLKQADGISGGQMPAVARCRKKFQEIARRILDRLEIVPTI
ncbi:MAG: AAA family ATPase [Gammaproteobacteria bacterium]|nr:AAA family ATPase [Gammaproteobacteria bacterium]